MSKPAPRHPVETDASSAAAEGRQRRQGWKQRVLPRRLFLAGARRLSPYVAVESAHGVFLVSTRDAGPGRITFLSGANPEFSVLSRAVGVLDSSGRRVGGSTFVDVGANIGTTTVPALRRHGFGRALCFEPEPENVLVLRANLALNNLASRAEVVPAAVADAPGRAAFGRGPLTSLGRSAGVGSLSRPSDEPIDVDVVTLDDSLAEHGIGTDDVGLVWLDVQGHEGHVLRGASRLVEARVPIVLAVRRAKLRSTGGAEPLLTAAARYELVVDLREPDSEPSPAAALESLVERRLATDVLLF